MNRKMRKRLKNMEARLARLEAKAILTKLEERTSGLTSNLSLPGSESVGRYEFPGTADKDVVAREMNEAIRRVVMRHGGMLLDEDGAPKNRDERMAKKFSRHIKGLSPEDRAKLQEKLDLLAKAIKEEDE